MWFDCVSSFANRLYRAGSHRIQLPTGSHIGGNKGGFLQTLPKVIRDMIRSREPELREALKTLRESPEKTVIIPGIRGSEAVIIKPVKPA